MRVENCTAIEKRGRERERQRRDGNTERMSGEQLSSRKPNEKRESQREKGFHSLLNTTPSGGGRAVYSFSNKSECLCLWISLTHWKQTSDVCTLQRQIWQWIKDITVCFLSCDLEHCFGFPVCVWNICKMEIWLGSIYLSPLQMFNLPIQCDKAHSPSGNQ